MILSMTYAAQNEIVITTPYFAELMHAVVKIQEFEGGLLHTKSITVDGATAMFGTVNLDMLSLWLN